MATTTYPTWDEEWIELAVELHDLADRINQAVDDDKRRTSTGVWLRPTKEEAAIYRNAYARMSQRAHRPIGV